MTEQRGTRRGLIFALAFVVLLVLAASIRYGAMDFSVPDIGRALRSLLPDNLTPLTKRIFMELRRPRALLCLLVGASLGVADAHAALFRSLSSSRDWSGPPAALPSVQPSSSCWEAFSSSARALDSSPGRLSRRRSLYIH